MNLKSMSRDSRKDLAVQQTEIRSNKYKAEIENSVKNTKIYINDKEINLPERIKSKISVVNDDTVSALFNYAEGKTGVLNFASYKHPGGGFITGAVAQEECLCGESDLYNVLQHFQDSFYKYNLEHLNKSLYLNRGLYSSDIIFFQNNKELRCGVITVAAPNKSAALKHGISIKENTEALKSRIKFVLDIAADNCLETLILGAYGCGVFGQDPEEVAAIFKKYLTGSYEIFRKVVFAIPKNNRNNNLEDFQRVFVRKQK